MMTVKPKSIKIMISVVLLAAWILTSQNSVFAASKNALIKKGNSSFSAGNYDEALLAYDEAAVDDPESPYIYYNKGTALYKKEEFVAAREAFEKAAIKSKSIKLEAKSKFNSGLCFFREGERQKDSDLKKTLEAYGSSVQSFQDALDLAPEFKDAAENIEMVRLMMKSVLDEIKKQEEKTKKQQEQAQKIAEKIQEFIERQDALLEEGRILLSDNSISSPGGGLTNSNKNIADTQDQLKQETSGLSQQLTSQQVQGTNPQSAPSSTSSGSVPMQQNQQEHPSKQHLDDSADAQEIAVSKLSENDTQTGVYQQEKSLDALKKALEAFKGDQNQQCDQQQKQQENQEQEQQAEQKQEEQNGDTQSSEEGDQDKNSEKDPQQSQAMQLPDDADNILDEEKENQKLRQPFSTGTFKEVDKDW